MSSQRSATAGESVAGKPQARRAATASIAGTTLEFYDFTIYGLASALVFSQVFFPTVSPTIGLLSAFATFGVGFLMRPIGGFLFGHIGDRFGRKNALVTTLLMMGISTVLIGCIPSFDSIGYWAPALLVILRLFQGLAYGGEWGGAVLMAGEHAPKNKRILYSALPNVGVSAGSLLGNLAFLLVASLGPDVMNQWAWRLPFWLGAILVIVGLMIRVGVDESPEFLKTVKNDGPARLPIVECFRRYPLQILLITGVMAGGATAAYINIAYSVSFATGAGVDRGIPLLAIMISNAMQLVLIPLFAILASRVGLGRVFFFGTLAWAVLMLFLFPALGSGNITLIFLAYLIPYGIGFCPMNATIPSLFAESFDPRVRYSGLVGAQLGTAIAGFTPFVAVLVNTAAGPTAVGLMGSGMLLLAAICGMILAHGLVKAKQIIPDKLPARSHTSI
ncbi:MFS transporter [Pseudarthrobacter sulfonivorans]|uniref:MFS transporter n=1 Tax=Pseudarthrobacter sulfonivorans TaxID=121292 RepID=UPI0021053D99|nr:MFS transporter [Pseudarthrobacter sulfonivorans]